MSEHAANKPAGFLIITDLETGQETTADTLQCVHCGGHWKVEPGSGKVRGFCTRCNGYVCGKGCAQCVPAEQLIENIEAGRPLDFRPVITGWEPPSRA